MTDYEKLKAVFTDIGVGFEESNDKTGNLFLTQKAKLMPNVNGYVGFEAEFSFTPEGKFTTLDITE